MILALLAEFNVSWLFFYPLLIACLLSSQWQIALILFMLRLVAMLICTGYFKKILTQRIAAFDLLIFDVCYPFFIIFTGIYAQFNKDVKWK